MLHSAGEEALSREVYLITNERLANLGNWYLRAGFDAQMALA